MTLAYEAAGRRTSVTLPNGVVEAYTYDAASRVTGITYMNGATELGNLTYTYDAAGNRTQIGGSWARMINGDSPHLFTRRRPDADGDAADHHIGSPLTFQKPADVEQLLIEMLRRRRSHATRRAGA